MITSGRENPRVFRDKGEGIVLTLLKESKLIDLRICIKRKVANWRLSIYLSTYPKLQTLSKRIYLPVRLKFLLLSFYRFIFLSDNPLIRNPKYSWVQLRTHPRWFLQDDNRENIFIDGQSLRNSTFFRGIGRFSLKFAINNARRYPDRNIVVLFSNVGPLGNIPSVIKSLDDENLSNLYFYIVDVFEGSEVLQLTRCQFNFNNKLSKLEVDYLVVPSFFEHPIDVIPILPGTAKKSAGILHDLIPLQYKQDLLPTRAARKLYESNLARILTYGEILSVSNFSANVYKQITKSNQPIHIILGSGFYGGLMAEDAGFESRSGLVCVGAESPHKNLIRLIEAYGLLPIDLRIDNPLKIVGIKNLGYEKLLRECARKNNCIIELFSYVTDSQLQNLYVRCKIVIVPSLAEGLSMPILEGWRMGAVGVGGKKTVLEEVIDSSICLFDPSDTSDISRVMFKFLTDADLWLIEQDKAKKRLVIFSWPEVVSRAEGFLGTNK